MARGALRLNPLESGWVGYGPQNGYNFPYAKPILDNKKKKKEEKKCFMNFSSDFSFYVRDKCGVIFLAK